MATLAQPEPTISNEELTAAEEALCKIFFEGFEDLPEETQQAVLRDLQATAAARVE